MKSSVEVYIPGAEVEACRGWDTPYVKDTCEVISPEALASKVLLGGVVSLHNTESVGISKVVHILTCRTRSSERRTRTSGTALVAP